MKAAWIAIGLCVVLVGCGSSRAELGRRDGPQVEDPYGRDLVFSNGRLRAPRRKQPRAQAAQQQMVPVHHVPAQTVPAQPQQPRIYQPRQGSAIGEYFRPNQSYRSAPPGSVQIIQ